MAPPALMTIKTFWDFLPRQKTSGDIYVILVFMISLFLRFPRFYWVRQWKQKVFISENHNSNNKNNLMKMLK